MKDAMGVFTYSSAAGPTANSTTVDGYFVQNSTQGYAADANDCPIIRQRRKP